MTKTEELKALKQECKELGLTGYSKKDIPELKEMIKSAKENQADTVIVDNPVKPVENEDIEKDMETIEDTQERISETLAVPEELIGQEDTGSTATQTEQAQDEITDTENPTSEPSKLHLQYKMIALVYTGEEEREFKEALNRPFPVLKNGDVVITDIKTGRFLSRKTSPFEMVDPSNIEINIKG